jgi:hypothetical protein
MTPIAALIVFLIAATYSISVLVFAARTAKNTERTAVAAEQLLAAMTARQQYPPSGPVGWSGSARP